MILWCLVLLLPLLVLALHRRRPLLERTSRRRLGAAAWCPIALELLLLGVNGAMKSGPARKRGG